MSKSFTNLIRARRRFPLAGFPTSPRRLRPESFGFLGLTVCLPMPNADSPTIPLKRILVVDDGPELPKAIRMALTVTGGYKIDIAADGKVALQMFEAGIYD